MSQKLYNTHNLMLCPCKSCVIRNEYANVFDMHFWGEDCPWECDDYKTWNCYTGKEAQDD